jgi:DNA repair and recombination protein RAD52
MQGSSTEFDDTFDLEDFEVADFDGMDLEHPDEVALPAEPPEPAGAIRGPAGAAPGRMPPPLRPDLTTPSKAPVTHGPPSRAAAPKPAQGAGLPNIVPQPLPGQRPPVTTAPTNKPIPGTDQRANLDDISRSSSPTVPSQNFANQTSAQGSTAAVNAPLTAGFYSAKAAANIVAAVPAAIPKFNPHAESPSIRKTSGVNHNRSVPLKRDLTPDTTTLAPSIINPHTDPSRRVGVPGVNGPLAATRGPNTSAYRPPTRRGPESNSGPPSNAADTSGGDRTSNAARRTPLGDLSNVQHNVTAFTTDGVDAKRQKVMDTGQSGTHETANNQLGTG